MVCYRKAADQGDARGQNNIARFMKAVGAWPRTMPRLCAGFARRPTKEMPPLRTTSAGFIKMVWNVAQDFAEAMRWYRKAADQGNATAQYNTGSAL